METLKLLLPTIMATYDISCFYIISTKETTTFNAANITPFETLLLARANTSIEYKGMRFFVAIDNFIRDTCNSNTYNERIKKGANFCYSCSI